LGISRGATNFVPWDVAEREVAQQLFDLSSISRTQYIFSNMEGSWEDPTPAATRYTYPQTNTQPEDLACYGAPISNFPGMYPTYQYLDVGRPNPMRRGFPCYRDARSVCKDTALIDFLQVLRGTRPLPSSNPGNGSFKLTNPSFEGTTYFTKHDSLSTPGQCEWKPGSMHPLDRLVSNPTAFCGARLPIGWQVSQNNSDSGCQFSDSGIFSYVNPEEGNYRRNTDYCPSLGSATHDTLACLFPNNHAIQIHISGQGQPCAPCASCRGRLYQTVSLEPGTWELGAMLRSDPTPNVDGNPTGQLGIRFFCEATGGPEQWASPSFTDYVTAPNAPHLHPEDPSPYIPWYNNLVKGWYYEGERFHVLQAGTYRVGVETEKTNGEYLRLDDFMLQKQGASLRNPQLDYVRKLPTDPASNPTWLPMYWRRRILVAKPAQDTTLSTYMWPYTRTDGGCNDACIAPCTNEGCLGKHGPVALELAIPGPSSGYRESEIYQDLFFDAAMVGKSYTLSAFTRLSPIHQGDAFVDVTARIYNGGNLISETQSPVTPSNAWLQVTTTVIISTAGLYRFAIFFAGEGTDRILVDSMELAQPVDQTPPVVASFVTAAPDSLVPGRAVTLRWTTDPDAVDGIVYFRKTGESTWRPTNARRATTTSARWTVPFHYSAIGTPVQLKVWAMDQAHNRGSGEVSYTIMPGAFHAEFTRVRQRPGPFVVEDITGDGLQDLVTASSNWSEPNPREFTLDDAPYDSIFVAPYYPGSQRFGSALDTEVDWTLARLNSSERHERLVDIVGGEFNGTGADGYLYLTERRIEGNQKAWLKIRVPTRACDAIADTLSRPGLGGVWYRSRALARGRLLSTAADSDDYAVLGMANDTIRVITAVVAPTLSGCNTVATDGPFTTGGFLPEPRGICIGEFSGSTTYGDVVTITRFTQGAISRAKLHVFPGKKSGGFSIPLSAPADSFCIGDSGAPGGCIPNRTTSHIDGGMIVSSESLIPNNPVGQHEMAIAVSQSGGDEVWIAPGVKFNHASAITITLSNRRIVGLGVGDLSDNCSSPDGKSDLILAVLDPVDGLAIYQYINNAPNGFKPPIITYIGDGLNSGHAIPAVGGKILAEDITGDGRPEIVLSFERTIGTMQYVLLRPLGCDGGT